MPDDVLNGILDSASDDQSANSTGRTPLVIDSDLRTIKVPTDYVFGVQNDQDVLTVPFVVPRYCDGVDLSELSIRINFTTKSGLSSYYDVTDKTVNTDTIEFTWLLGAAVFVSVGDLTFAVCIRKVEADGRITKEFNTTLATAKILPGLTVEDQKDPTQYSILVQMQNIAESVNATIEDAEDYAEQLRNYVGAPLVATAASDMTDQNRIYVYVGNENGYNNGHWYYYQSLTWHDGGSYNALTAGDYPDIYAGNVISDRYQMDSAPYLFRPTVGGLQRIGDRCYPVLVGASVGENQLIRNGDFSDGTTGWGTNNSTLTASNNVATYTRTTEGLSSIVQNNIPYKANHKYFVSATLKASVNNTSRFRFYSSQADSNWYQFSLTANTESVIATIFSPSWSSEEGRFYIYYSYSSGAIGDTLTVKNVKMTDLTQKFGSSIADYIYTLESATAGSGIAWLRNHGFLRGYQAYNDGSLESVEVTEKKCVGFNQWDEVWEVGDINRATGQNSGSTAQIRSKNYIPILPNTAYYLACTSSNSLTNIAWLYYDADYNFIRSEWVINVERVTPANAHYIRFTSNVAYGSAYNHDICINLSSDRNGEYEPYTTISYPLGTDTLRGIFKLDANNQLYADGDRKTSDGTVTRKYKKIVIDGNSNIIAGASGMPFGVIIYDKKRLSSVSEQPNAITDKLIGVTQASAWGTEYTFAFATQNNYLYFKLSDSITTIEDAKTYLASNPIAVVYELATPTTETSTPFTSPQIVYPDGTEEFVTENGVSVGHVTKYPYDLKTQAERLIDIPDVPSTNGTYVLKATRSSSGINYTWVTG